MPIKITYFVHSTTFDNEQHLAAGWVQGNLSPRGLKEARELGLQAPQGFEIVFSSDLRRASETAHLAFGARCEILADPRLREINYGDLTRRPGREVKSDLYKQIDTPFANGESYRDVERRVGAFLDSIRPRFQGRHIAIVAHQAPQLALEVLLKGRTWRQAIDEDWRQHGAWQPGWEYLLG